MTDPDVGTPPLNQGVEVEFEKVSGPTVILTTTIVSGSLVSAPRFRILTLPACE